MNRNVAINAIVSIYFFFNFPFIETEPVCIRADKEWNGRKSGFPCYYLPIVLTIESIITRR